MASEGTDSGGGLATHLAKLDPSLAAVLNHIVGSTSGLDAKINAVKQSQDDMKADLQNQIDALSRAVANVSGDRSGNAGASGASGSGNIEHMFMQADTIEQTIKKNNWSSHWPMRTSLAVKRALTPSYRLPAAKAITCHAKLGGSECQ